MLTVVRKLASPALLDPLHSCALSEYVRATGHAIIRENTASCEAIDMVAILCEHGSAID